MAFRVLYENMYEILLGIKEISVQLFDFLLSTYTIGTREFTLFELLFGGGLFVFLGIKIALAVIQ